MKDGSLSGFYVSRHGIGANDDAGIYHPAVGEDEWGPHFWVGPKITGWRHGEQVNPSFTLLNLLTRPDILNFKNKSLLN